MEQECVETHVVEEELATHLSPSSAPSWKKCPSKPCRTTSALIGDSYITAGQGGEVLDTMPALQVYQADVYKDEGADLTPETVKELRRATDLVLSHSMAGLVLTERLLWFSCISVRLKLARI